MASNLPTYIASAKPLPPGNRVQWFSNVAPTYAGVMVWFAFWQQIPGFGGAPGGLLSAGLMPALVGLVVAALICHYLFYLIPGLLGMKTGLPLYVVGTSTYGVRGGLIMPGLLMGALQFCWLGFNAFFVSTILCQCFEIGLNDKATDVAVPGTAHGIIAVAFAVFAAFVGLKGIQYVAKVATFLPIIPIVVLLILFVATVGGLGDFTTTDATNPKIAAAEEDETKQDEATEKEETAADAEAEAPSPLGAIAVMIAMSTCIVGFFATAGAAGVDIAMNSKDEKNVKMGGLTGIAAATIFSGTMSLLIVAGYLGGTEEIPTKFAGNLNPVDLMKGGILSAGTANVLMILLAISSFPAACFSAMIAANCFRTTLPNVNPFISVGIGTAVACVMAVTGWAGDAAFIFTIIGASFGPVCGAMMADYLLAGKKWAGPRSGWNLAGWISWTVGFAVGGLDIVPAMAGKVPCPPMAAFVVGFVLYVILAKAGMESEKLEMPTADSEPAAE
ncbi:MAG: cytosine permease [Planctomycetes bacterium]|nr:cytosine permease [Planctomycetota bacterium]